MLSGRSVVISWNVIPQSDSRRKETDDVSLYTVVLERGIMKRL